MIWKILTISAAVLSVFSLVANIGGNAGNIFGGTTAGFLNTSSGFQISGSTVIGSDSTASTSNITGSGTLTITGESNLSTLVFGGSTTTVATTGAANAQMTAAQFCDNAMVFYEDESASSSTVWLPNATQLIGDCIPAVGDMKSTYFINITDDTASTTLTASTSVNLKMSQEADAILQSLSGNFATENDNARIWCVNNNGTEVDCYFETIFPGD